MEQLRSEFAFQFPNSSAPAFCRAPGRVNLIGEHTDYNGLPVLPMAIDKAITIAFSPRSQHLVRLVNGNSAYRLTQFENRGTIPPSAPGAWDNYVKAAAHGLNRYFGLRKGPGMNLLVTSNLPTGAGLSSSSALVVGGALAWLACQGIDIDSHITRLELADLLAQAEHFVGSQGGGMDQAIILCGQMGTACKIDFFPLRLEQAQLPKDFAIVLCHSLVTTEKSGVDRNRYNEGPYSCRLICAMVERHLQNQFGEEIQLARLGELWFGNLCMTHGEVKALFEEVFPRPHTTVSEAAAMLNVTQDELCNEWLPGLNMPANGLPLQARARHQLTEYQRVEAARDALQAGDAEFFGELMNASHQSCAEDYGVSCPELDALTQIARSSGAIGARLTGAGFGGCTVNLVPRDRLEHFHREVTKKYYEGYLKGKGANAAEWAIQVVEPAPAAGYVT